MTDIIASDRSRSPRAILMQMFEAAVAAASPSRCIPPYLPQPSKGRTIVVGGGKAAAAMAAAVEAHWKGDLSGLVVTRYGHPVPCRRIEVVEAAHPIPDEAGQAAAERLIGMVEGLTEHDLVLCLFSGGASALLAAPSAGISLADIDLGEILCVQEERQVGNGNCVWFNRLKLQIPASPSRAHFVKARVKVRQYHDGTHAIFHGPRCLGRYDRSGATVDIPIAA